MSAYVCAKSSNIYNHFKVVNVWLIFSIFHFREKSALDTKKKKMNEPAAAAPAPAPVNVTANMAPPRKPGNIKSTEFFVIEFNHFLCFSYCFWADCCSIPGYEWRAERKVSGIFFHDVVPQCC